MSSAPEPPTSVRAAFIGCTLTVALTTPCNPIVILGGWWAVYLLWGPYTADNDRLLVYVAGFVVSVLGYVVPASAVVGALWRCSARTRRLVLFAALGLYIGCVLAFFIAVAFGGPL